MNADRQFFRRVRTFLIQHGGYCANDFDRECRAGHILTRDIVDALGYVRCTQDNWRDVMEFLFPGWKARDRDQRLAEEHRREFDAMFTAWEMRKQWEAQESAVNTE